MNSRRQIEVFREISFLLAAMPVVVTIFKPEGVNPTIPLAVAIMLNIVASKQTERMRESGTGSDAPK